MKPEGFEDCLSGYEPLIWDSSSIEVVAWGFKIICHLSKERLAQLETHGDLKYSSLNRRFNLVMRWLTRQEAIELYGPVTNEELGPRGGWRSVTFGEKKFVSKCLKKI